jgi:hypothetical protein
MARIDWTYVLTMALTLALAFGAIGVSQSEASCVFPAAAGNDEM